MSFPQASLLEHSDTPCSLNTCLTVRAHEANSHQKQGWEQFTQRVLDLVATHRDSGVVFMAWGKPAAERVKKIDTKKHLKLESVHPSPLSAARGFFDCAHFVKANDWLTTKYGVDAVINWDSLADSKEEKTTQASREKPAAPTAEDERGQLGHAKTSSHEHGNSNKPAVLGTEESFGITKDEEDDLIAAQEEVERLP